MKKFLGHVLFLLVYLLVVAEINESLTFERPADYPAGLEYAKAKVIEIVSEDVGEDPDYHYIRIGKQTLKLEILSGEHKGEIVEAINYVTRVSQIEGSVGTKYIVGSYDNFTITMIMYLDRSSTVYFLAALFLALVLLIGRKKGVSAIAGLLVTLINVVFLFMPMLINGVPAILAAIIVVLLSTFYTMVVLNGFTAKSMIATISCTLCTAIAGALAYIVGDVSNISALNTPEAENLLFITEKCPFRIDNLLTAGILIAAMGAVMDTCMSLVSSLYEMKEQTPSLTGKQLWKSGMNIGRDIMGTMTNTLALAFVGSSLNSVLVYYMYSMPYVSLINTDFMVVELVKGIIGSLAVVLAIPVTTLLASYRLAGYNFNARRRGIELDK